MDGSFQIEDLDLAGTHLANVRAQMLWKGTHVDLTGLQGQLEGATVKGALAVVLRGRNPEYTFTGKVSGLNWQSGKLDAQGTLETSGTGVQLLSNLRSEGTFSGAALDFGTLAPWRSASGSYALSWSQTVPRLRFTDLLLRTDDDVYTGRGNTQDDGRLLILLTNGAREMRMSGTFASLKIDQAARP
jgi:hypothetical protein